EGRFLLIGGGYGIRVLSWDYQRKQRRSARQETAKAILNRGRTALRWGKLVTVVRQKPGALGRNQPGTFTRGGREATKRPGHPVAPDPDWLPVPNRRRSATSFRGWFNETNLLRLTAVAVLLSVLFLVLLLVT
ncbi:MAG: hypothetical protein H7Z75_21820, partial [Ferruginibacter sp.]|nr:hypothetical protein [Cytophagales bacterium]